MLLALFIRTFIVQAFKIPSGSMKETLQIGDHILVNKFIYGVRIPFTGITLIPGKKPRRGDILVFRPPHDPKKDFIKRVVGVPGDIISIRDKQVFVNGVPEKMPYAIHVDRYIDPGQSEPRDNMKPKKVPADSIFVMGDNRDHSYDSRYWGTVKFAKIKGKAFMIYWSWDKSDFGVRWNRLGNWLR